MTTFLLLTMIASQPPQAPPLSVSVPPQAPTLKVDTVAELWAKVKGGAEVTVYVGQDVPKDAVNAVQLESFDGEKSGAFRCFLHGGEPSYKRVETAAPTSSPEKKAAPYSDPIGWHRHKCESPSCGFVWSHPDGTTSAGHYCPGCGKYENDKYRGTAPPTTAATPVTKKRVSLNGRWYDQYSDGRLVECAA